MANTIIQYVGNGVSAVFSVPFPFPSTADLVVTLTDTANGRVTPQTLDSDYIVTGGNGAGGAVAMMSAPANGQQLTIALPSADTSQSFGPNGVKTEAQMRAASMMLVIELALSDLYPDQVSSSGGLWDRKIAVRLNDLEHMIIDYSSTGEIRAYVVRLTRQEDGGAGITPEANLLLPPDADIDTVFEFVKNIVLETASMLVLDPATFVYKIADITANSPRMRQAMADLGTPPIPVPLVGPGPNENQPV